MEDTEAATAEVVEAKEEVQPPVPQKMPQIKGEDVELPQFKRTSQSLLNRYPIKETSKERIRNLNQFVHEDLLENSRVSIKKWNRNSFERGLKDGEAPFPVTHRLAPFLVR